MKTKNRSRTLFSALLARISKKFKIIPEGQEKIVEDVMSNGTLTKGQMQMDETNVTENVVENVAVVETPVIVDGPQEVRTRNGKKGPGSLVVVVPNLADAEAVKAELSKTLATGQMVFSAPHQPAKIVSAADFLQGQAEISAKIQARKDAIAALSPEIRQLLEITE